MDDSRYKYCYIGYFSLPPIEHDEWNYIPRVSYSDRVLGYFKATISRANDIVSSITIFSVAKTYKEFKIFEKDLLSFFLKLLERFPTIMFAVVIGNPVRKKYRKFIEYVGGNIIGISHKSARVGLELLDEELYEIHAEPNTIEKITELKERIKID